MADNTPPNPTPDTDATKPSFATMAKTNEWGQITDLEPNASYFVLKKPTVGNGGNGESANRAKDYFEELKGFLHEHRVLAKKQLEEMKARYGDPKSKAQEVRGKVEERFDQVARELEQRYEKLENDVERSLDRILGKKKGSNGGAPAQAETPGEMPRGEEPATAAADEGAEPKKAKKTAKKAE